MSIYQKQIVRFLIENCTCKYYVSAYIKNKTKNDEYMHDINGLTTLIRVDCKPFEPTTMFQYYWLYNINDATKLICFLHNELQLEAHEVIIHEKIKLFLDIDMKLSKTDMDEIDKYYDAEDDILSIFKQGNLKKKFRDDNFARELAYLYFESIVISLGDHGCKQDFDMSFSTRNRQIDEDTFKISIHIFTNIIATYNECKIIAAHVRTILNSHEKHDLDFPNKIKDKIIDAVDLAPYHKHGSLSINGGSKYENGVRYITSLKQPFKNPCDTVNKMILFTYANSTIPAPNLSKYNAPNEQSYSNHTDISQDFYKKVIDHMHQIDSFDKDAWVLDNCRVKGAIMRPTRFRPSYCPACDRQHDNDNTLIIIMNETIGKAYWKCAHATNITKGIEFYKEERIHQNSDLDRFVSKHQHMKPIKATTDHESDNDNDCNLPDDDAVDDSFCENAEATQNESDNDSICEIAKATQYESDGDDAGIVDADIDDDSFCENAEATQNESDNDSICEIAKATQYESDGDDAGIVDADIDDDSSCENAEATQYESDDDSICENAEATQYESDDDADDDSICENAEATQNESDGDDTGIVDDVDIDDEQPDIDLRECRSACYMTVSNGDLVSKKQSICII